MANEKINLGDNLEFLRTLETNSIDLIYSDILYGTGRDFVEYQDLNANKEEIFDFYIPRVKEMYRVLKPTGSIYLQMDSRINHWLRCILDDVFGYKNFKNEIVWKRRTNTTNTPMNGYRTNKDIILYYTKSNVFTFNIQRVPISKETIKRYNKVDANGDRYLLSGLKHSIGTYKTLIYNGKEYTGKLIWSQKTLDKRISEIELNSLNELAYRVYLKDSKGKQLDDIWLDLMEGSRITKDYPTKKPDNLMARIIKASSNEGDVIADFFCGSGTFGIVGKKHNRNVILCDIGKEAIRQTKIGMKSATNLFNS